MGFGNLSREADINNGVRMALQAVKGYFKVVFLDFKLVFCNIGVCFMRKGNMKKIIFLIAMLVLFTGCSINRMAVRKTGELIGNGMSAIYEESDLQLAKTSIAANLKLMEVLLKSDPGNSQLKLLLAQGYGAYALAFIEDEDPERAKYFYLKARDFALEVVNKEFKTEDFAQLPLPELQEKLKNADKDDVEPLFWLATYWGSWVMLSLDNNRALFALPKIEAIMQRIIELDESFYFAGAHLFFGSLYAAKPVMLGGKPAESKKHFDRALELTDNNFLLTRVYYAAFYAVRMQDGELFDKLLNEVLEADLNILPEFKLINQVAKKKAIMWKNRKDELF